LHLGSHGSVVIISDALLLPALIDAAQRWPPTKNSNGQRRGGTALKNKSTGASGASSPAALSKHLQPTIR
jgi:hypothetical protein